MPVEANAQPSQRPRWRRNVAVLIAGALTFAACGSDGQQVAADPSVEYGASLEEWAEAVSPETAEDDDGEARAVNDYPEGYEEVAWEDLLPPGFSSDEIYARYEDRLAALEDGSPEADAIFTEMQAEYDSNSGAINTDLDGTKINLAGFVAPLSFDEEIITEFLLVPYFGACIHVPAPPPNQTILVTVDEASGLTLEDTWGAVWVAGTITVDQATTDLATASYTMIDATSGIYDEYG